MSDLVLGSTTVLSDSSGTPTIQSGVKFPAGNIIGDTAGAMEHTTHVSKTG